MMIEISIQNGISKYLQSLIRNSPDFVRGCSKSMGDQKRTAQRWRGL